MQSRTSGGDCRDLVAALLRAIEERDLRAMEERVEALRGCLRPAAAESSMQAEKLDALTGFADEIDRSLRRMRTTAAGEMARIRAAAPLLEHVAMGAPFRLPLQ